VLHRGRAAERLRAGGGARGRRLLRPAGHPGGPATGHHGPHDRRGQVLVEQHRGQLHGHDRQRGGRPRDLLHLQPRRGHHPGRRRERCFYILFETQKNNTKVSIRRDLQVLWLRPEPGPLPGTQADQRRPSQWPADLAQCQPTRVLWRRPEVVRGRVQGDCSRDRCETVVCAGTHAVVQSWIRHQCGVETDGFQSAHGKLGYFLESWVQIDR